VLAEIAAKLAAISRSKRTMNTVFRALSVFIMRYI
jgi:hypothetical protein